MFDVEQTFVYNNDLYFQPNPFTTPVQVTDNKGQKYVYNGICDWLYEGTFSLTVLLPRQTDRRRVLFSVGLSVFISNCLTVSVTCQRHNSRLL